MPEDIKKKTIEKTVDDEKQGTDVPEFTEEQQAYIDKIVGGIKAENKKKIEAVTADNEQKISKAVDEQLEERERRAKMSAEEKAQEDIKALQNANAHLQAEIAHRDLVSYGHSIASQYHVPSNMVTRLVGKTNDETLANMKDFADSFTKAVQAGVDERLASTSQPQQGSSISVDDDKKLSDLSLDEQTKLFHENPDLYSQLASR